jgi:hypothetical protein
MKTGLKNLAPLLMIGEGVFAAWKPRAHSRFWGAGPKNYRRIFERKSNRSTLTRVLGMAGTGLGVWWAMRQFRR